SRGNETPRETLRAIGLSVDVRFRIASHVTRRCDDADTEACVIARPPRSRGTSLGRCEGPVFNALIVEADAATSPVIHEALADAGCVDIETMAIDEALAVVGEGSARPDLIVLRLEAPLLARLRRLARARRDLP